MIKRLFSNKVVRNAGWLVGGRVVQMIVNLVVGLITARYLGPSNYGLINYAAAYLGFFSSFCTLGINSVLVKELVDNRDEEGKVIGTSIVLRVISALLSALTIVCFVAIIDHNEPTTILVVLLSSVGLVFQIFEVFNYWFQSKLQSKITATVSLVAYIVTAAYRVVLLLLKADVEYFALATSVDYVVIAILLLVCYKKNGGGKLSFSWDYGKALLSKSCHFIISGLMVAIYAQTDKIMLKHMIGETEVGFYSTAVSICSVWCFVLQAIIDSMYPIIAEAYKTDKNLFKKRNKQLYAIVFYVSLAVSLCFTLLAEPIVLLMYGESYLSAVAPLKVITWYTAFSYLGVARNAWIVCENRQRYLKYVYFSAALANVVLNLILIPAFGTVGAAIASLTAQVVTTMITPFFIKGLRENSLMMVESVIFRF